MTEQAPDPDDDIPSGLPDEQREETPLGVEDADPEHSESGPEAMPGIPTDGEPPAAS